MFSTIPHYFCSTQKERNLHWAGFFARKIPLFHFTSFDRPRVGIPQRIPLKPHHATSNFPHGWNISAWPAISVVPQPDGTERLKQIKLLSKDDSMNHRDHTRKNGPIHVSNTAPKTLESFSDRDMWLNSLVWLGENGSGSFPVVFLQRWKKQTINYSMVHVSSWSGPSQMIIGSCVTEVLFWEEGYHCITGRKIEATFANSCFSRSRFPSSSNGKNGSRTFWCIATIWYEEVLGSLQYDWPSISVSKTSGCSTGMWNPTATKPLQRRTPVVPCLRYPPWNKGGRCGFLQKHV